MTIRSFLRRAAILLTLCALALSMTACFTAPDVVEPTDDTTASTDAPVEDTPEETTPTVAVPKGQLSLSLLMGVMSKDMTWSELSVFDHTVTDDTHAVFEVADGFGKTCQLTATFDAAADTVSEATLSYNGTSVNVLTDDTLVIRTIMIAMNAD